MSMTTLQWDSFQYVPFDSLYVDWISLQLLSNGLISIIVDGFDQRMYISYGTAFEEWTNPIPLIGKAVSGEVNLDQSKCPLQFELPNGTILFIQTRLEYIYAGYSPFIEVKIIHNDPNYVNIPLILAMTPETQLTINNNDTSTLTWFVWDNDPYLYKIYRDEIVVQEGTWSNTTPITYTAPSEQFSGEYNFSIWVSDKTGNTNSDYWGNHTVSPLPEVFPALQPTTGSFDILFLSAIFLITVFTIIVSILLVKRSRS